MNFNNSKYDYIRNDSRIKELLIAKGIKQAWHRRFSHHIHSGVRVKVQRKNSSFIEPVQQQIHHELKSSSFDQTNHVQSMIKRLRFGSETSALSQNGQKSLDTTHNSSQNQSLISYQTKPIFNDDFLRKYHLLGIKEKDKSVNSIGIQTTMITQIDRQTSCDLVKSISMLIKKSRSSSSSSTVSSETSISNENSTQTDSTSTVSRTTNDTNGNDDHNIRYRRNKNRNNNAIDTNIEPINMKEFKKEKALTQLSNNEQQLQDINNNTQYYSQMTSLKGKKRFFNTFFNLISFLRLSLIKRDRVCISTTTIGSDAGQNERNTNIRSPTSRCRRSTVRNFNHNSSIKPKTPYFHKRSEENSSSKLNPLQQKASIHSVSDITISTRKQCRQANNSSLSIVDSRINFQKNFSHQWKKKSTRRDHSHRKKFTNPHHQRKYIHTSNRSSYFQWSSQLKPLSIPSIIIENQRLSSVNDQSKVLIGKCVKSSDCLTEYPCLSKHEEVKQTSFIIPINESNPSDRETSQEQDLFVKSVDNLSTKFIEDKRCFSPPPYSIRLRVKNKNLISNLSKSKIQFSSIYPLDNSIQHHQMNIFNEFKSILRQTKNIQSSMNRLSKIR